MSQVYEVSYINAIKPKVKGGIDNIFTSTLYTSVSEPSSYVFNKVIDTTFSSDLSGVVFQNGYPEHLAIKKKRNESLVVSKESDLNQTLLVLDSINVPYKLSKEKSGSILGFPTSIATATWRGRRFKFYYTSLIPVNDGPYKFFGLPGLILKVEDDLDEVQIVITKISILEKLPDKCNLDTLDKFEIRHDEFAVNFKKNYWSRKKFIESQESNTKVELGYRYIEIQDIEK
jgi:GLPGLI family protein